jgi:class 3 adenylate cyclase/tetratricopeptide (TPR) repeat protein
MTSVVDGSTPGLARLVGRLLDAARAAARNGDVRAAREMAEDTLLLDPGNAEAQALLVAVERRSTAGGERALVSLLFSDLVGSTALADEHEPETIRDLFRRYREVVDEAVGRYGGTILGFYGDGVLACFGHPASHEDDARRAVRAGLDIVAGVTAFAGDVEAADGFVPEVRVGIHSGLVVVAGLGGPSGRRDDVVGVVPNLAARIQSEARAGEVLVSDVTRSLTEGDVAATSVGLRALKGIPREVELFRVDRLLPSASRLASQRYRRAALVGRAEARDRLEELWRRALAGGEAPSGVDLRGPAGIGKSRLASELRRLAEDSGGSVLEHGCSQFHSDVVLWPIARSIEAALGPAPDADTSPTESLAAHLDAVGLDADVAIPFLAPLVGFPLPPGLAAPQLDPAAIRQRTLDLVHEWTTCLARRAPRLMIVEDVQWADPTTAELVERFVADPVPSTLLVVTSRDDAPPVSGGGLEVLELAPLSQEDAMAMVAAIDSSGRLPAERRRQIVERGEGVPLFVEELTLAALAEHDQRLPLRLQELLAARIRRPDVDLRAVQVAATIGHRFTDHELAAALGLPVEEVTALLAQLDRAGVVEAVPDSPSHHRFRHVLLRDAAYDTQVRETRRATHAAVAAAMAQGWASLQYGAVLAQHLELAGSHDEAVTQYEVAARAAQAAGAHREALRLLTRAIEVLEMRSMAEHDRALQMVQLRGLRVLSRSVVEGYAAPDSEEDLARMQDVCDRLGPRPETLPALLAVWSQHLTAGRTYATHELVARLLRVVEDPANAWFEPEVRSCSGYSALYSGQVALADAELRAALDGFERRPPDAVVSPFWPLPNDPLAVVQVALACVRWLRGHTSEADALVEQALERARGVPFPRGPFTEGFVHTYAAWLMAARGDLVAAAGHGIAAADAARPHGLDYFVRLGSAWSPPPDGDYVGHMRPLLDELEVSGHRAFRGTFLANLATVLSLAGDVEGALSTYDDALAVALGSGEHLHRPEILRRRALLELALPSTSGAAAEAAVAALRSAVSESSAAGAELSAVIIATDVAGLDPAVRPADWRVLLASALDAVAGDADAPELDRARALLS